MTKKKKPVAKSRISAIETIEDPPETGMPALDVQAVVEPAKRRPPGPPRLSLQKDPRLDARGVAKKPPEKKRALGLDLGTNCGAAFADFNPGQPIDGVLAYLDQLDLSIGTYDTGALRHLRLRQFLTIIDPDLIFFEDVKVDVPLEAFRGKPLGMLVARIVPTAEFLGCLKLTVSMWAAENNVPVQGVAIAQIKKFATGSGNAGKVEMIKALNEQFGTDFDPETFASTGADNLADAGWLLAMALSQYSEGFSVTPAPES